VDVFGSVGRAVNWFIDGLVDSIVLLEGRRRRIALVRAGNGYAIEQPNGDRGGDVLRIEDGDGTHHFKPPELAASLRHRDVDIVLPADEVLVRTLDPLPGESRQFLDSIVQHQLERVAPWRSDDVLHTYRVTPAERGNDRIVVTVIATARSMHERVLEAVAAMHAGEIRLLCRDAGGDGGAVPIPVDRGAAAAARQARLRLGVIAALGVLLLAIIGGSGYLGWDWYVTDSEVETVTQQVAAQRQKMVAARASTPAGDVDLRSMIERRATAPFIVLALDALAGALPDDTFLSELRVSEGRMRMTGISRNVAGLVPLIESSPAFSEATFFAPTTRLPAGQGDRFHLEARLKAEKAKP
jgi:general secretion pathway protein L